MSIVLLADVKRDLRLTHNSDDTLIQQLIDGAEDEAKQYLDRGELPRRDDPIPEECESDSTANAASDTDDIAPAVRLGIFLLVKAAYEGVDGAEMDRVRGVAFGQMRSYRKMGV